MSDELLIERRPDGIVVLTLNRPDRRNAMTEGMTSAWRETLADLSTDRGVRCVVVTGAGDVFCSGGDLGWIHERNDQTVADVRDRMLAFYRTWLAIGELEAPTIAAINGAAVGAGLCFPLACDLRYAAEDAKLVVPFTALGLHPGMAATYLLPRVAGLGFAREMLLTGRVVTGAEAVQPGLVNRAFPREAVLDEALEVAEQIAAKAPVATRLTKAALARGHADLEAALAWESVAQPVTMTSADLTEGLAAQREKRAPRFTGR